MAEIPCQCWFHWLPECGQEFHNQYTEVKEGVQRGSSRWRNKGKELKLIAVMWNGNLCHYFREQVIMGTCISVVQSLGISLQSGGFLPARHAWSVLLRFLCVGLFVLCVCPPCHVCSNYITYVIARQVNLTAALSTGVAIMSSLAQLQVWDTEKQRQCRHDHGRLTESRNARSK